MTADPKLQRVHDAYSRAYAPTTARPSSGRELRSIRSMVAASPTVVRMDQTVDVARPTSNPTVRKPDAASA